MPFPNSVKEEALVRSRRCCCVCQEFAGLYTNVHHIVPESDGGSNDLGNAIVLCLRCHGEVGHYNIRHPIGNKYSPDELRRHRDEWWRWCENNPAAPLPKHPITVSPGVIDLGTGGWKACSPFKIHNRTNEIYYKVWIKLTIDTPVISPKDIGVELANPMNAPTAEVGNITVFTDVIIYYGTDLTNNKKVIFLLLNNLDPGYVCTFGLKNNSSHELPPSTQHKILISVCSFTQEPAQRVQREGEVALQITPPENFKIESMSLRMKRTA